MADIEIAGKDFMNYTDLREKNKLAAIEVEQIKNYARSLNDEQMRIFLAEVPYQTLMEECSRKFYALEYENKGVRRLLGM
jgi:hypothetical protein